MLTQSRFHTIHCLLSFKILVRMNFLSVWQTFYFPIIDTINGKIRVDEAILGPYSQSGSGEVFKIDLKGVAEGNCPLNITYVELRNLDNQIITASLSNAVIQIRLVVNVSEYDEEKESKSKIEVYPNPFNSTITIQFDSIFEEVTFIGIFNINGEQIFEEDISSLSSFKILVWNGIDRSGNIVPSGIYFVSIKTPNNFYRRKILLLK